MTQEHQSADHTEVKLLDVALLIAENIRALIVVPLAAGVTALGVTYLLTPTYTATTRVFPPQQQQSAAAALLGNQLGVLAGGVGSALGIKNPADLYAGMVKSRTVADKLLARFNLRQVYDKKYDEDVRKELAERTNVIAGRDGLIAIEVQDQDPKRAADLANAYVDGLRELTQTLAVTEAAQRRLFFEKQLKQTKDDLTRAEVALRGSGINEAVLKTVPQSALEELARLKAQVTAQEVKLGAMRGYMTESNPEFRQAQQELAALHLQLAKTDRMDATKPTGAGAQYIGKYRDFKYYETLFELMSKQYEMARLDEAREGAVIQVVDAAVPPDRKSKPRRGLIAAITSLLALSGLVLLLFVRQWFANAKKEHDSAQKVARLRQLFGLRP